MRYLTFSDTEFTEYKICFLVPELRQNPIEGYYINPYLSDERDNLIAYELKKEGKKTPATTQKEFLASELLPVLRELEVEYLVVCDAEYFKTLTKNQGPEANLGYVLGSEGSWKDDTGEIHSFEGFKVLYCPNFNSVFRDEVATLSKIDQSIQGMIKHIQGSYVRPGSDIIHHEEYPETVQEIGEWLDTILAQRVDVSSDIEAFSLKHYDAGIGTITLCWNQHEGIAFGVDLIEGPDGMPINRPKKDSRKIRQMLKDFFRKIAANGNKTIWHNIAYDAYVLVYQLFMKDILDTSGLLDGLAVMLAPGAWEDTKHITYLATNSCSGNKLGLKDQAQEFAGNYAVEEIKDIRKIPFKKLLKYNLIDGLSTWFVFHKHYQTMVDDDQLDIYQGLFRDSTVDIIQMQLTGLPLDMKQTIKVDEVLCSISSNAEATLRSNPIVEDYLYIKRHEWIQKENAKLKTKTRSMEDAKKAVDFNPNSPDDLKCLLYAEEFLGLPVLDITDTKEPATGGDTLKKLVNHATRDDHVEFINALIDYKAVDKIITSFMPKFLNAYQGPDGWHYVFGNFNLGGTVSGRLSSSGPNLQNLPANVVMAITQYFLDMFPFIEAYVSKGKLSIGKLVKSCFKAPPGFLFIGLDFASLEDRISALQTKDPEKLKVYTDGYDGHSLRAYSYFGENMPDIDPTSVSSINSIGDIYKGFRQDGKTPTFLLTYGGTYRGIMDQMGWPMDKAQMVEKRYHDLYTVSDQWVADQIHQASKTGYVVCAFGLRVRTPILAKTILGNRRTPFEAEAEARTAGNALGQSYCMLNSRAGNEFMGKVRSSQYRLDIRPCAHIHDAQYFIIPEDIAILLYVNEHLVKAVQWQDDPRIWHDEVKLGGELSIFYPSWAEEMEIPNNADQEDVFTLATDHLDKYQVDLSA